MHHPSAYKILWYKLLVRGPLLQFGHYISFSDKSMKFGAILKDNVLIRNFERHTLQPRDCRRQHLFGRKFFFVPNNIMLYISRKRMKS